MVGHRNLHHTFATLFSQQSVSVSCIKKHSDLIKNQICREMRIPNCSIIDGIIEMLQSMRRI